jgi:hypothetical protein
MQTKLERPEPLRKQIISEIDSFLSRTEMPPTRLGMDAVGDANFVKRLRNGISPRIDTLDKLRRFMWTYQRRRRLI